MEQIPIENNLDQSTSFFGSIITTLSDAHIFDLVKIALLCYFFLLLILTVFGKSKKQQYKQIPTRERLLRRFLYANQDVLKDLDEDEKKLMTMTFENTVKNAKAVEINNNFNNDKGKQSKKVIFNTEKNTYHEADKVSIQ